MKENNKHNCDCDCSAKEHKHSHTEECNHPHHNHSANECNHHNDNTDVNVMSSTEVSQASDEGSDSTEEEPPQRSCHQCANHKHKHDKQHKHGHEHNHAHHHHKTEWKDTNKFTGFIWSSFEKMGWVEESHDHHHHDHNHDHHGHDPHEGHNHGTINTKFWILVLGLIFSAVGLTLMLLSVFNVVNPETNWYIGLGLGMSTIIFLLIGIPFCIGSTKSIMKKEIAEDTLVAISTTSAYVFSLVSAILFFSGSELFGGITFFFEALEILSLIYLGRYIEDWLTNKVTKEMNSLDTLKAKNAIVIRNGKELEIDVNELVVGDIIVVKPGTIIPVDGIVVEGKTTIDESSLTGESLPIAKKEGSTVFAGTISSNGLIKIEATKVIGDSFISLIIQGVNKAQAAKPETQRLADKIAGVLVPAVLVIALATFIILGLFADSIPWYSGDRSSWEIAMTAMMTVMVIACPCSFAMITPMGVLAGSTSAKREGVIFNSKNTFEIINQIDIICFDKTGTLTEGKFKVIESTIPEKWLQEVINIENTSNHPLANSIVKHFKDITPISIKTEEVIGKGVKSKDVYIGSHKFVKEILTDFEESKDILDKRLKGSVVIYAFTNKELLGYIELKDQIKDTSLATLSALRKMGIEVAMITGDQKTTAETIASQLGINSEFVYSEVNPEDKASIIKGLQDQGKKVAFVGDGINDSVALVQANLGIAVAEGSDAAIEAADIILNKNDMELVAFAMHLSRKTLFNIKRGFGIAVAYNLIAVPIAATGFIPPAFGAISMIFNDSVAMINAMTLLGVSKNTYKNKWKIKK